MKHTLQNKLLGGLLGTAVGDAIGELAFVNRSRSTLSKAIQQIQKIGEVLEAHGYSFTKEDMELLQGSE